MITGQNPALTYSANVTVSAILLDAGGVLVFPQPEVMLPPLREAGLDVDLATLRRAHYWATSVQDRPNEPPETPETPETSEPPETPEPPKGTWHPYLVEYIAACGAAHAGREELAARMAESIRGHRWTHVAPGVHEALREIAGLGVTLGVVSNSDGTVEAVLRGLGLCYACDDTANDGIRENPEGIQVGVVLDSGVVGIEKPDPEIFRIALKALGIPADDTVLYIGDTLRYDVAGALAAGIRPVHLDPHGYCPAPDGHAHITSLADLPALAARP